MVFLAHPRAQVSATPRTPPRRVPWLPFPEALKTRLIEPSLAFSGDPGMGDGMDKLGLGLSVDVISREWELLPPASEQGCIHLVVRKHVGEVEACHFGFKAWFCWRGGVSS